MGPAKALTDWQAALAIAERHFHSHPVFSQRAGNLACMSIRPSTAAIGIAPRQDLCDAKLGSPGGFAAFLFAKIHSRTRPIEASKVGSFKIAFPKAVPRIDPCYCTQGAKFAGFCLHTNGQKGSIHRARL
jgi:hypothetical protein